MRVIVSLVAGCLLATHALADNGASAVRLRSATRLLRVMDAQRASEAGSQAMVDAMVQGNPMMAPYRSVIIAWTRQYVAWRQLEPRLAALYAGAFTESELQDLVRFYQTPTGRKAARVMPGLARRAALIGASLARQHIPELRRMIAARAAQLQKAAPQH